MIALLLIPVIVFWGTINALFKDLAHRPCSVSDLNYKPLFTTPIFPLVIDRIKYNRARKCLPISIFFKDTANEEQIAKFIDQLKENKNIYLVDYISRKKAIENYKESIKNQPIFLETMPEGDFLPASTAIFIDYPENKNQVIADTKLSPIVSDVIAP